MDTSFNIKSAENPWNTPDAVNQFALDFIQQHREERFTLLPNALHSAAN